MSSKYILLFTAPLWQGGFKQMINMGWFWQLFRINSERRKLIWQYMTERKCTPHLLRQALHQLTVYFLKAWPLFGVSPPAAQHQVIVHSIRTAGRLWQVDLQTQGKEISIKGNSCEMFLETLALWDQTQIIYTMTTVTLDRVTFRRIAHLLALVPEELACVFNDLLVRELGVGLLLTQSQDLPQRHPECPHITGHGELTLEIRWTTA